MPVSTEDPIDVAISHRIACGGLKNTMLLQEAKKQKVSVPVPLKLKVPPSGANLVDLLSNYKPPLSKEKSRNLLTKTKS